MGDIQAVNVIQQISFWTMSAIYSMHFTQCLNLTLLCVFCLNVTDCRKPQILHKIFQHSGGITLTTTVMVMEELVKNYKGTTH